MKATHDNCISYEEFCERFPVRRRDRDGRYCFVRLAGALDLSTRGYKTATAARLARQADYEAYAAGNAPYYCQALPGASY
jgi:hypothetical protein